MLLFWDALLGLTRGNATVLKRRTRKKKKPRVTKGDESPLREIRQLSQSDAKEEKDKVESESMATGNAQVNQADNPSELLSAEQHFLKALHSFMCDRNTPIARIPHLGFKKRGHLTCRTCQLFMKIGADLAVDSAP